MSFKPGDFYPEGSGGTPPGPGPEPATDFVRRGEFEAALAGKVATTDPRLSDARAPTAHAATHAAGGSDAITPAAIGAATVAAVNAKADKVSSATEGNFAALVGNGNLADSGKKASDFAPASHSHAAADLPGATTSAKGVVQLSAATNSTSQTTAATSSAVKAAYDRASTAITTANSKASKSEVAYVTGYIGSAARVNTFDTGNLFHNAPEVATVDSSGMMPMGRYPHAALVLWDESTGGRGGTDEWGNPLSPEAGLSFNLARFYRSSDPSVQRSFDPLLSATAGVYWRCSYYGEPDADGESWSQSTDSVEYCNGVSYDPTVSLDYAVPLYVSGEFWKTAAVATTSYDPYSGAATFAGHTSYYPLFDSAKNLVGYSFAADVIDMDEYWMNYTVRSIGYASMRMTFSVDASGRLDLRVAPDDSYGDAWYFHDDSYNAVYPDDTGKLFAARRASTAYGSQWSHDGYFDWSFALVGSAGLPYAGWNPLADAALGVPPQTMAPLASAPDGRVADARATGAALAGKAASPALRYDLKSATASGTTSQTVTVSDRAITSVSLNSACASLTITPPSAVSGKARDFLMRVTVQGSAGPSTVTFGSGQTIDIGATDLAEMEAGVNVLAFTEISANHWMVARRGA